MAEKKKNVAPKAGAPSVRGRIRALLVGINRYSHLPDYNQLHGCVNDTKNVASVLCKSFNASPADIRMLHDERATKAAILARLSQLVRDTQRGEVAVFHMSSHGSLITRREPSGALKDHISEILCLSSIPPGIDDPDCYISDSDLVDALRPLKQGALFVAILDACHSGADGKVARDVGGAEPKSRFLHPPADIAHRNEARESLYGGGKRHRLFGRSTATIDPHVIVLAACGRGQTSDDAPFKDPDGAITTEGAFSHFLCEAITKSQATLTYRQLLERVQRSLSDNDDKQAPEMAPAALVDMGVFSPFTGVSQPVESPAPTVRDAKLVEVRSVQLGVGSSRDLAGRIPPELGQVIAAAQAAGFAAYELPSRQVSPNDVVPVDLVECNSALILEYEDGVIVWHKPSSDEVGRSTGQLSPAQARAIFKASGHDITSPAPGMRRVTFVLPPAGSRSRDASAVVQRIFYVITHPIQVLTREILKGAEALAFKERLWQFQGASIGTPRTENPGPIASASKNVLLLIHGVLSSVDACFGKDGSVIAKLLPELQQKYIVLGYDHLSATPSIDEIACKLNERLGLCVPPDARITIVAHSQGGVIARALASLRPIQRIVVFGSPLQGTHLVNGIEKWISILLTISALVPGPIMQFATQLLKAIDDRSVIPGFLDLGVGGEYLKALNGRQMEGATVFDLMPSYF